MHQLQYWLMKQLVRLFWAVLRFLSRIGARPALTMDLANPSANPIVNEQLAALTQCQRTALDLRRRYAPGVAGPVMEMDMIADAALRSIDDILLRLDRTRRELVKTQHPLKPEQLQGMLAQGRQLEALSRALG
jgi:hypothetical protein